MRRHGWAGAPPQDEAEARARLVQAARDCVDRSSGRLNLSDVAELLGITRQTVYRYYANAEELLLAVSGSTTSAFLDRAVARLAGRTDPAEVVVEGVAYALESLAEDAYLALLLRGGGSRVLEQAMISRGAVATCRTLLERTDVDWVAAGFDDTLLDELAEHCLRLVQSLVTTPPDPVRTGPALRAYLRRWLAPAVTALGR